MSSPPPPPLSSQAKGKQRESQNDERAPLLLDTPSSSAYTVSRASSSTLPAPPLQEQAQLRGRHRWLKSYLLTSLLVVVPCLVLFCLVLALLAGSYAPALTSSREALEEAVVWRGPSDVRILNVTEEGCVWVQVEGWIGVDTDRALGFERADEEGAAGLWERLRRSTARKAVGTISSLNLTFPSPILISSSSSHSPLLSLQPSPSSLVIPLTPGLHSSTPPIFPPHGKDASVPGWLSPVSLTAHVDLVAEPDELLAFLKTSWASQRVRVGLKAEGADVRGVGRWLGKVGGAVEESVELDLDIPIPCIPQLPSPPPRDLTDLVHLTSHSVSLSTSVPRRLLLHASATAPNILQGLTGAFPFEVDFRVGVLLPPSAPDLTARVGGSRLASSDPDADVATSIAVVHSLPLVLSPTARNLTLSVEGTLLPPTPALSTFLASYLSPSPLPLLLTYLPSPSSPLPPSIAGVLSALSPIVFPIPPLDPPVKLIRSVTIEGMKLATSDDGKTLLASGTVRAEVQLPLSLLPPPAGGGGEGGESTLPKIDVKRILPDVLIFDGPAPSYLSSSSRSSSVSDRPLPSPLPERVFARLNPSTPIPAFCHPSSDPSLPGVLLVRAPFEKLPVEVLDDKVLSGFVGKVLLRGGALAGVKGWADVGVRVEGLSEDGAEVEVGGLELEGEIWVGRARG